MCLTNTAIMKISEFFHQIIDIRLFFDFIPFHKASFLRVFYTTIVG